MSIKTVSLYVQYCFSDAHPFTKAINQNDIKKELTQLTIYNSTTKVSSINYCGVSTLFAWINREKVTSIVLNDFKLNEVLIILDKKNVSVELKKITSSNFPIVLDSFKDNMLAKKILREALFWINNPRF